MCPSLAWLIFCYYCAVIPRKELNAELYEIEQQNDRVNSKRQTIKRGTLHWIVSLSHWHLLGDYLRFSIWMPKQKCVIQCDKKLRDCVFRIFGVSVVWCAYVFVRLCLCVSHICLCLICMRLCTHTRIPSTLLTISIN